MRREDGGQRVERHVHAEPAAHMLDPSQPPHPDTLRALGSSTVAAPTAPSMATKPPADDVGDRDLTVSAPKQSAAGIAGVAAGLAAGMRQMGVKRTALTLLRVNQVDGFDCPGCAWPEPPAGHRAHAEFCENGAKAVAEEATLRRITPEFFARHPISELAAAFRPLARPAGETDGADGAAGRRGSLHTDRLGRRVRPDRRKAAGPELAERGDLLHVRPYLQ